MDFEQWKRKVDVELVAVCGVSSVDLADAGYRDGFDSGLTPREMAEDVLEANDWQEV